MPHEPPKTQSGAYELAGCPLLFSGTPAFGAQTNLAPFARETAEDGALSLDLDGCGGDPLLFRRRLMDLLLPRGVLLFHAAAVSAAGNGVVFAAPSGTGKTTHAKLWRDHYGAEIINGDMPFLRVTEGGARVHGSPWTGHEHIGGNLDAPLKAVVWLARGGETRPLRRLGEGEAFLRVMNQTYMHAGQEAPATELLLKLLRAVPVCELVFAPDGTAEPARACREGLESIGCL